METIAYRNVTTRKTHQCFGCGRFYPAKTSMGVTIFVDRKKIESVYWCPTCRAVMNRDFEPGDDVGAGDVYAGDPDRWNEVNREIEAEQGREDA